MLVGPFDHVERLQGGHGHGGGCTEPVKEALDVVAVPVEGAGSPVLFAPIKILIQDFWDDGVTALRQFRDGGVLVRGGQQRMKKLFDFRRCDPLAVVLLRRQGVGGKIEKVAALAVQDGVPAVAFRPVPRRRFSGHEWNPQEPCECSTAAFGLPRTPTR
jgi:hypothetical protein